MNDKRRIVILSGMAGAGLTTARTAMEDIGFVATDNPPLSTVEHIIAATAPKPLALGIDARADGFDARIVIQLLDRLNADPNTQASLLFLECEDSKLLGRFSETRRRHPLATDRPVEVGLAQERQLLAPLKNRADIVIDTTDTSTTDLRHHLHEIFPPQGRGLSIQTMSFSYRHGVPREADFVFDARFLRNPHYISALKPKTGQDKDVGNYIADDPAFTAFFHSIVLLMNAALPGFQQNDRPYLTIAFGCTGGKHRSVYLAECTANYLEQQGHPVRVKHREMEKAGLAKPRPPFKPS